MSKGGRHVRARRARHARARCPRVPHQGRGVRRSATATRSYERAAFPGLDAAARPRPRDRRARRRGRRRTSPRGRSGDRVGVGWHGGHCFECNACRKGLFINCEKAQDHRHHPRRRLRRVRGRPDGVGRAHPGGARRRSTPARSCAPASPPTTRCATAARGRATRSRCRASAASATSRSSTPRRWAFAPSPSRAAPTRKSSRASSARTSTSTRRRSPRPRGCRSSAAPTSCSRPRRTATRSRARIDGLKPRGKLLIVAAPFEPLTHQRVSLLLSGKTDRRLAERQRDRLRGDDDVQRAHRRPPAHRDVPARAGRGGFRQ